MADKRRGKRKKDDYAPGDPNEPDDKATKEEYAVAKWMRANVLTKKTKFLNHNVEYFTGSKAVDMLLESPWSKPASENEEPLFTTRRNISEFLDTMLQHKFFHRAKKVPVSEEELKAKLKKKEKKDKDDKKRDEETAESSHAEGGKESEGGGKALAHDERKKKKHKIRLEMHLNQCFVDCLDAYVWIYDPIPFYYWIFGFLVVLGAIAICMFPLWPPTVRMGVYYLSIATAGFLLMIIALAFIRLVVFCIVWLLTLGVHHLWLFPNLTEDVGFFASFWPLYQYEYRGKGSKGSKTSKKKKKDKYSDNEDNDEDVRRDAKSTDEKITDLKTEDDETENENKSDYEDNITDRDVDTVETLSKNKDHEDDKEWESESESEGSSQQSQTGKDFEMIDKSEIQES